METINHEYYVSLEIAKMLKKAGFDWEIKSYRKGLNGIFETTSIPNNFNDGTLTDWISTPTLDVAQRWLRELKHLNISVDYDPTIKQQPYVYFIYDIDGVYGDIFGGTSPITNEDSGGYFYTYEEAQEEGIKRALELILEK